MIQTMLKERFGLRWHNETKTGSVYELIRAKVGPQLHETSAPGRGIAPGPGKLTAFGSPMSLLAKVLSD